jgi:hypothetical protein
MENTKFEEYLRSFRDAVLTGVDAQGYPVSVRCHPQVDEAEPVLRVHLPADIQIAPGPLTILMHVTIPSFCGVSLPIMGAFERYTRALPQQFRWFDSS